MLNLSSPNLVLQAPIIFLILASVTILVAAIYDVKTFTIPHIFPIILIGLFVVSALISNMTLASWAWHIASAILGFTVALLLYILGPMGGGDVKLFAAVALWFTPSGLPGLAIFVTLAGLVTALIYLGIEMSRARIKTGHKESWKNLYKEVKQIRMPYGPAIALGTGFYYSAIAIS